MVVTARPAVPPRNMVTTPIRRTTRQSSAAAQEFANNIINSNNIHIPAPRPSAPQPTKTPIKTNGQTKTTTVLKTSDSENNNMNCPIDDQTKDISHYYHIHMKKLGEGGFAKVRLATHLATRQSVAIKCLDKSKLGPELPRIYNEIKCLKRLKHQNIARLYQVFETQTTIYLVLEYCPGGELFDYIVEKSKLTEAESAQIIYDLMRVLDFIHANGFAHRDLKPENLLFDDKHQIKLIDFGLAANCSADNLASNTHQAPIDELNTCCGSVSYAAPEVISGASYSGTAIDVWSTGVMLYALLVGKLPFNDNNVTKLYQQIKSGLRSLPSFLSPEASDLIRKMLTIDPKHRITVRQVLAHPWLRNKASSFGRINRRLEFAAPAGYLDEQIFARCFEKFPEISQSQLREYILKDFNHYSTTYHLLLAKSQTRGTGGLKRALDQQQMAPAMQPIPMTPATPTTATTTYAYASPTKRSRFVTVTNTPKTPKTPPAYLRKLHELPADIDNAKSMSVQKQSISATPSKWLANSSENQQENANHGTSKMDAFIYKPTPKKSILKRLIDSATPSKLKKRRKKMRDQEQLQ